MELEDELARVNRSFRAQNETVDELLGKVTSLQNEKRLLEEHTVRAEQDTRTSRSALHAVEKSCARKEEDLEKYRRKCLKAETERTQLERLLRDMKGKKDILEKSLTDTVTENEELRENLSKMDQTLSTYERTKHQRYCYRLKIKPQFSKCI